jgi:hypothetical protein
VPRAPLVGIVALAFGTVLAGITIYVAGTVADAVVESGLTMEMFKSVFSWLLLMVPIGIFAALLLRLARTSFLPRGWSQDGEVRVEFAAPPRIGHSVAGRLWFKRKLQAGETFRIRMWCDRNEVTSTRGRDRAIVDHVFMEEKEAVAVATAGAASLPFAFDVPTNVPVSAPRFSMQASKPRWFIELVVPKSRFSAAPEIDFEMGLEG